MQLEIGKTYFNHLGESIKIIMQVDGKENPFIGMNISEFEVEWLEIDTYYPNGSYLENIGSKEDLIQEANINNVVSI